MDNFIQQIFTILTTPPGNLIYHLVLVFSTMAAFQSVLAAKRSSHFIYTRRILFGLAVLLVGQIVLFVISGLSWQGLANPHFLLPPAERAITAISLVWIIWLWSFPTPARFADIATGLLNFAILVLYLFTITAWNNQFNAPFFNSSGLDWGWQVFSIFIAVAGILLLLFQRPAGWGFGFTMLFFSAAGAVFHLMWGPVNGDFPAIVRLFQLCSYPLLPALAQHVHGVAVPETPSPEQEGDLAGRKQWKTDPRAIHAWIQLIGQREAVPFYKDLTKAISQTMMVDLCYLLHSPSANELEILCGYDLLREESLPGTVFEKGRLPALYGALQREKPLRLEGKSQSIPDFEVLTQTIGLEKPGELLLIPLTVDKKTPWGLLLLSPYSNRIWDTDDQAFLMTLSTEIARSLSKVNSYSGQSEKEAGETPSSEGESVEQNAGKQEGNSQKEDFVAIQKDLQAIIANLQAENDQLHAALNSNDLLTEGRGANIQHFESELHLALEEVAHLQNALAGANMKILSLEMQNRDTHREPDGHREVMVSLVQEIRQPMASIAGYTDLLMTESVGILGELQRKFLERIKSSIERMNTLLGDLIRVSSAADEEVQYQPELMDITTVIDDALTETASQLREKNLTLRVDLPDTLPLIQADRDAIQQIIMHLLQNAGAATPPEGAIDLKLSLEESESGDFYLLLKVADSGGGIATEDIGRIFSRQVRAENALVQGLGDTGVGLSIAQTLTEAQGGKIWVESIPGKGAIFNISLPVQPDALARDNTNLSK
ncbi:MAG: GAF domain-containing sensor histidine kinase [Anaerolineaceae bacterium]|nr:GAF domain-containing sensor histidine kinase [Anaerolineaceae bacterium]